MKRVAIICSMIFILVSCSYEPTILGLSWGMSESKVTMKMQDMGYSEYTSKDIDYLYFHWQDELRVSSITYDKPISWDGVLYDSVVLYFDTTDKQEKQLYGIQLQYKTTSPFEINDIKEPLYNLIKANHPLWVEPNEISENGFTQNTFINSMGRTVCALYVDILNWREVREKQRAIEEERRESAAGVYYNNYIPVYDYMFSYYLLRERSY